MCIANAARPGRRDELKDHAPGIPQRTPGGDGGIAVTPSSLGQTEDVPAAILRPALHLLRLQVEAGSVEVMCYIKAGFAVRRRSKWCRVEDC